MVHIDNSYLQQEGIIGDKLRITPSDIHEPTERGHVAHILYETEAAQGDLLRDNGTFLKCPRILTFTVILK